MDGNDLLALGLIALGIGVLKILSEEGGPLYIKPAVLEDPRTVKVKVTEPSETAKESQKYTEFDPELRHFRLFDVGVVAYGVDKQVYLLRNLPEHMRVHYIQPFVEIGLYRTEEVRIEFQILDAEQRLVAVDSVICQFPGKKAILTPSPRSAQYFKDISLKSLTLEILIYDRVFARHTFALKNIGYVPQRIMTNDEPEIVDGELTGEIVAFFQKNIMDEVSIEELLGS